MQTKLNVSRVVLLAALALMCSGVQAGPNRRSTVDSTPSGAANLNPDGSQGQELDEGGGNPTGNYCSVTIGPNKETWVCGIGRIVIIPTTVQYTRTYELNGWDKIDREGRITGCEVCVWFSSAYCAVQVSAEAGKSILDPDDIAAQCSGELRYYEYGLQLAADVRECTVTNTSVNADDLEPIDSEGNSWPSGHGISRAIVQVNGGSYLGQASILCQVSVPLHPGPWIPILPLAQKEYARLYMNVQTDRGHAKTDVVHTQFVDPADGETKWNNWKVNMQAWDYDDPQFPLRIDNYVFDGASNQ